MRYCYTCARPSYDSECINKKHLVYDGDKQIKKFTCRTGTHTFETEAELIEHEKHRRFRKERP